MSDSDAFVPKCGHPCRYFIEHEEQLGPPLPPDKVKLSLLKRDRAARELWQFQWRFRTFCCRCENREPCSLCAPLDTPEDKRRRDESFEIGRKFVEEALCRSLEASPEPSAPPARSAINWGRGFRRLGVVLGITLSVLVGLLLWAIDLGIVFIWLIVLAALAWAAVRAARWVLVGFRVDSDDRVDPRGPKGK